MVVLHPTQVPIFFFALFLCTAFVSFIHSSFLRSPERESGFSLGSNNFFFLPSFRSFFPFNVGFLSVSFWCSLPDSPPISPRTLSFQIVKEFLIAPWFLFPFLPFEALPRQSFFPPASFFSVPPPFSTKFWRLQPSSCMRSVYLGLFLWFFFFSVLGFFSFLEFFSSERTPRCRRCPSRSRSKKAIGLSCGHLFFPSLLPCDFFQVSNPSIEESYLLLFTGVNFPLLGLSRTPLFMFSFHQSFWRIRIYSFLLIMEFYAWSRPCPEGAVGGVWFQLAHPPFFGSPFLFSPRQVLSPPPFFLSAFRTFPFPRTRWLSL